MSRNPEPFDTLISGSILDLLSVFASFEQANTELQQLTGIHQFFSSQSELKQIREQLLEGADQIVTQEREWGDFQTPLNLARQICRHLLEIGVSPTVVVEPTFGLGNFILAALENFPNVELVYGIEIQDKYRWQLKLTLLRRALITKKPTPTKIVLNQADIFTHHFPEEITGRENILIIGNPPWVTNAELGSLSSGNLPKKQNLNSLNGLDALTGKSNFDISEYILLKLLEKFSGNRDTLAMLCKTATARNIVMSLPPKNLLVSNISMLTIDAGREFRAAVDAGLLIAQLGSKASGYVCKVGVLDNPYKTEREYGWVGRKFVADVEAYRTCGDLDGKSSWEWRQGVKHDCAAVMELEAQDGLLINGKAEIVEIEDRHTFWLLKSSDLRCLETAAPRKKIILSQFDLAEDTSVLKLTAPKLWNYLIENGDKLDKRKSSIYRHKPRFAIFGVGEYSFKPYKVAISGLYKEARFSLICPIDDRAVMLDDTCYFLGFDDYLTAMLTMSLLNTQLVKEFLRSIVFIDAKRPYTKEVLMRIELARVAAKVAFSDLQSYWLDQGYTPYSPISESHWITYQQTLMTRNLRQMEFAI